MPDTQTDNTIYLNKSHPKFLYYMEILCMIPPAPGRVSMNTIAEDMGLRVSHVEAHIGRLRNEKGYRVTKHGGRQVSIARNQWPVVKMNADRYWKEVYGE